MYHLIVCYLELATSACVPVVVSEPVPYEICEENSKKILRWNDSSRVWSYCQKEEAK